MKKAILVANRKGTDSKTNANVGGVVALIGHFVKNKADDDGLVKVTPSYEIGGLTAEGKYQETKESIYTKEAFECQGLVVTPQFDSTITYQVFFYDALGNFVDSSASLEGYYRDEIPSGSSYARIVITPKWDKDIEDDAKKINIFQINKYAKQLTVKVAKEQNSIEAVAVFVNLKSSFDFDTAISFNLNSASFVYEDVTLFENATINKIGVPVKSVTDCTADNTFTVYVMEADKTDSEEYVKKYELKIKANTFSSNTVNEWYYFDDIEIKVGKGETLAFSSATDSVIPGYYNVV